MLVPETDSGPDRSAWAMVLYRALEDLGRPGEILEKGPALLRDRALAWFRSDREDEGSFLWICRHLDLPAERYRAQVERGEYNLDVINLRRSPTWIRRFLTACGITVTQAAAEMGIPRNSLSDLVTGRVRQSAYAPALHDYLERLEAAGNT